MKNIHICIVFCIVLIPPSLFAQPHYPDEWWPVGKRHAFDTIHYGNAWLHFTQDSIEILETDLKMSFEASVAVASDIDGNVLFYSNGCEIRNATGNLLVNGGDLNPGALHDKVCRVGYILPRSMAAIPMPNQEGKWLLLHFGGRYDPVKKLVYEKFYYTEIEMISPTDEGVVLSKNNVLFEGELEPFSVLRHGNGRDWWVVMAEFNSNKYHNWLISPTGIAYMGSQTIGVETDCKRIGGSVFSKDGSKYARTNNCAAVVMDYNRCTGVLSNAIEMSRPPETYGGGGLAFSDNNRWLYATSDLCIFRADLQSQSIFLDSLYKKDYYYDSTEYVYSLALTYMQPSPSGLIMMSGRHQDKYYSTFRIEADTFKYLPKGQKFPVNVVRTLPYFPNFRLFDWQNSLCDTLGINPVEDISPLEKFAIQVKPNPFWDKLKIQWASSTSIHEVNIKVSNMLGQVLEELPFSSEYLEINTSNYPSGLYYYTIYARNKVFQSGKLVKFQ